MKYRVLVDENIRLTYEVEADNEEDARSIIEGYWQGDCKRPYGEIEVAMCDIVSVTVDDPRPVQIVRREVEG
jgi:hypothetical protein